MFKKILIANRGEIACRIIRTCNRLGIRTVAVYSDADQQAQHVIQADEAYHLGGPRPADSYLKGDAIIEIAKRAGAEAIHPGYGFLSENEHFAAACAKAGIVFIGPRPDAIEKMGSKSHAKALMQEAGVPVVPGYHGDNQDPAYLALQSEIVGYPQLIKAVAGGGGKGMRLVSHAGEFMAQLEAAQREAKNAFGDDAVLIERFIQGPHHIEFQVFGDNYGNYLHMNERECSIQRRHQKILEETPSPFLDDDLREEMGEAAVAAARAIAYRGAGTVEFIMGEDSEFYFMEMNTRLQVEHPITELVTGVDLVEFQLRIAAGYPLDFDQDEMYSFGHAIEVRICAENPANDFLPETGHIAHFELPTLTQEDDEYHNHTVRLDTGVVSGDDISVYYDSMIAKLVVYATNRDKAILYMQRALAEIGVIGVKTNLAFLQQLLQHPNFIAANTDTGFIGRHLDQLLATQPVDDLILALACGRVLAGDRASDKAGNKASHKADAHDPWANPSGWRMNSNASRLIEFKLQGHEEPIACHIESRQGGLYFRADLPNQPPGTEQRFTYQVRDDGLLNVSLGGRKAACKVIRADDALTVITDTGRTELTLFDPFHFEGSDSGNEGRLTAMMPGRVVKLMANQGDLVKKGQALIIMEAMKMEHTIVSPREGTIARVAFQVGEMVPADAVLFAFEES